MPARGGGAAPAAAMATTWAGVLLGDAPHSGGWFAEAAYVVSCGTTKIPRATSTTRNAVNSPVMSRLDLSSLTAGGGDCCVGLELGLSCACAPAPGCVSPVCRVRAGPAGGRLAPVCADESAPLGMYGFKQLHLTRS